MKNSLGLLSAIQSFFLTKNTIKFLGYHNVVVCGPIKNHWVNLHESLGKLRNESTFLTHFFISLFRFYIYVRYIR